MKYEYKSPTINLFYNMANTEILFTLKNWSELKWNDVICNWLKYRVKSEEALSKRAEQNHKECARSSIFGRSFVILTQWVVSFWVIPSDHELYQC